MGTFWGVGVDIVIERVDVRGHNYVWWAEVCVRALCHFTGGQIVE